MQAFLRHAAQAGLNVSALLPSNHLLLKNSPPQTRSILLLGSSGRRFFEGFWGSPRAKEEPLDTYTQTLVESLVAAHLPAGQVLAIDYPFLPPFLPFQRLAEAAGLGRPGPLGILVHPEYGPWFALRAALSLTDLSRAPSLSPDVCTACPAPCASACPEHAVQKEGFDTEACGRGRSRGGECAWHCPAREACPIGVRWRYSPEAIEFHHRAAGRFFP